MCGIAGFVDFNKSSIEADVSRMSNCLQHRGPDGQGVYFVETNNAAIGLGHRRLSIIDLSHAADQPMHYDGLHIIFNGEIYNYVEIKDELIKKGHQFQTHSDTEVILHSWREWGQAAIQQWHGMFAITLYDEKTAEIICIRDRAGVKPLYYYFHEGLFLFSSELKSIASFPNFKKEISPDAVAGFLQYGYVSHPQCIYKNTFKVSPGNLLRLNLTGQSIALHQYWNVYDYYN